jgi:D-beta-D-heptose 7-phosphate kinase/D-beta-D-heptose 1-phosphate adenosyltransferase
MSHALSRIVDSFRGLEVAVVGEAMLDRYLVGTTGRLCREAPVPIVALSGRRDAAGGAANTAVNAAALGAKVHFLSVVGDDPEGDLLRRELEAFGVETAHLLVDPARRTLSKTRVVAASQLLVRFDEGTMIAVDPSAEQALIDRLGALWPSCDALIISDYGYGILTPRVIGALADRQRRSPRVVLADSKDLTAYREAGLTAVKPNYEEALPLLGGPSSARPRADDIAARGGRLLARTGARLAAVTLDTEGAVILERGRPPYRTYARPTQHSRAAGAGDTFLATLALALAAGAETPAAADLASAACEVVVGREGTAVCHARDLHDRLAIDVKPSADRDELAGRLAAHRREGRRVVFTNGCFDILHRGHITYLSQAKALGDILVVGVNSDESIRRLKGSSRPINVLEDRIEVLAALSCVDHLIAFDEDTPCELVRTLRPDVFVKGGDYTVDRLPEAAIVAEQGGEVRILPFIAERSTTDIIARIRAGDARPVAEGVAASPSLAVANGRGGRP